MPGAGNCLLILEFIALQIYCPGGPTQHDRFTACVPATLAMLRQAALRTESFSMVELVTS